MRRRAVLVASLTASLLAHAAAAIALSSRPRAHPPEGRERAIDVELLTAAAPAREPGLGIAPPGDSRAAPPRVSRAVRPTRKVAPVARETAEHVALRPFVPASAQPVGAGEIATVAPTRDGTGDDEGATSRAAGDGAPVASGGGYPDAPGPDGADAPDDVGAWTSPDQAQRNCVQESVRLPASLRGFASRTLSVKFAVAPDGTPGELQILGKAPDDRVGTAIWHAIQACRWTPGTDGRGRPAKMWVIMPIRFERG